MEHTELVPNDSLKYNKNTNNIQQSTSTITRDKKQTSTVPKTKASCIPFIKQHIRTQDIPESVKEIILASWRTTTKNRYNTTYQKWQGFCSEKNINSIQPTVNGVISFFSLLYHQGQGYQSICNARSALNNIIYLPEFSDISQHPLIKRFIKDIFNLRPPQPRYAEIWYVSIVFRFIDEYGHNEHLTLKKLTIKTATILLLLSGERINTLSSFDIKNMVIDEHKCVFIPSKLLKHSRPCYVNKPVKFYVHEENPNICPVQTITHYLDKRNNNVAHETTFFITHGKPFKAAHEDTISC